MTMTRDYRSRDHDWDDDDRFDRRDRPVAAGSLPIRAVELVLRHPLTSAACVLSLAMFGVIEIGRAHV